MAIEKRIGAYSAYAIAVENGFEGTAEEWLESLIGPRGYQGWGVSAVNVSADGSLIFTIKNPETGETRVLEPIQIETLNALNSISTAKDEAVNEVKEAQTQATEAVDTAGNQALQDISDAKTSATSAVNTAGTQAVDAVNTAVTQAASDAQTAITAAKNQAVSDVQAAGQSATENVQNAQTAGVQAVKAAQTNAVQAVQDAGGAEAERLSDIVPLVTEADEGKILTVLDGKWTAVNPAITNWGKVQLIVRAGLAPQYFPVGYEFTTHDSTENTDIVWRVVGYDTIKAANELLQHTMILETKYVYCNSSGVAVKMQTDAAEVFYYAQDGVEAGTYHFTLPSGYDEDYGGGKTYFFTLANPVPTGGVLLFTWGNRTPVIDNFVYSYSTKESTDYLEKVGLAEGNDGTDLGTADGSTPDMNYIQRARFGSNNYAQSAIRQWLNSAQPAGNVWTPQTKFDRAPSWASSRAGFMAGLPEEFLSVICPASILCRTNEIYEVDSLDKTEFITSQNYSVKDKFFILSQPEVYGSWDSLELKDGEQLDFYTDLSNVERIKYDLVGIEQKYLFRTPNSRNTNQFRSILTTTGNISSANPTINYALNIACIIA